MCLLQRSSGHCSCTFHNPTEASAVIRAVLVGRVSVEEVADMKATRNAGMAILALCVGVSAAQAQSGRRIRREVAVSQAEQEQRIREQQQREAQYRRDLDQRLRLMQQQNAQLQQRRAAQYRAQQEYAARLQEQQRRLQAARDYSRDPYISAPMSYRYNIGGTTRLTNQYGADALKQAVNYGYQEGVQAGKADTQDRYAASYQNSMAYRDANYGYDGNYVSQSDYNYYFRQGFRRGYNDGYYSRSQYGTTSSGTPSILSSLLSSILGLQSIR